MGAEEQAQPRRGLPALSGKGSQGGALRAHFLACPPCWALFLVGWPRWAVARHVGTPTPAVCSQSPELESLL